jgi:hypothetical protein
MKRKKDVQQGTLALMVQKTQDVLGLLNGYGNRQTNRAVQRRPAWDQSGLAGSRPAEAGIFEVKAQNEA